MKLQITITLTTRVCSLDNHLLVEAYPGMVFSANHVRLAAVRDEIAHVPAGVKEIKLLLRLGKRKEPKII